MSTRWKAKLNRSLSRTPRPLSSQIVQRSSTFSLDSLIKVFVKSHKILQSLFIFKDILSFPKSIDHIPLVFPLLLKSYASVSCVGFGLGIHGYMIKRGFIPWVDNVSTSLIEMYLKFGKIKEIYQLFEEIPLKNDDLYDFLVGCFGSNGFYDDVLVVFEEMLELGFFPCVKSVFFAVMACGELRRLDKGLQLHDFVFDNRLDANVLIGNSLISMYIKMARLDLGRSVFIAMKNKDIVSWNSLITGYAQRGNWKEAFKIFLSMKEGGNFVPNVVTFLGLAFACAQSGKVEQGKSIHGFLIRTGLLSDFRLGTALVDMYSKCDDIECAQMVFEEGTFQKGLVSWNSLISGYSHNGYYLKAVMLFKHMITSEFNPDAITIANVLPAYSAFGSLEAIKSIHAIIMKKGLEMGGDVVLGTAMIDAYGKCLDVTASKSLFSCIKEPNVAAWNAMLAAYCLNHHADLGLLLFFEMLQSRVSPDEVTIVVLLQLCGELESLKQGSMAHGYSFSKGFSSHITVENAIMDMYMRCRSVEDSERNFRSISQKTAVTWNTMLSGYAQIGSYSRTIEAFSQMQSESKCRPDSVTLISLIQASSAVFSGHGADISHAFLIKLGFGAETSVVNSLIDAYTKNGMIENAISVFMQMGQMRDQCSWNVMIAGYGINGQGLKACELLDQMEEDGCKPDSITFTSLLSSCVHSGLIEEGCRFFSMMSNKYNIKPGLEHWTCIIDMLGRAGRLEDAYQLLVSHGDALLDSDAIWGALLDACRTNMNSELGELAGKKLLKLAPENCGYHTLFSNLYVSTNRWDEAVKVREVFQDTLIKKPGLSLVQVCRDYHGSYS
ncbi:hypothetical protein Ancab_030811 [Ancistrocladus abbreviatus]